nr:hypothetical protein [Pseudarthrobacter sp. SSS035]
MNVTVPAAHHPVTTEALTAGLPVLGEKPMASTVAQGLSRAAASELTGQLIMVSQSRRNNRHLFAAKRLASSLGETGIVTANFFKAPHFGGFRDAMGPPPAARHGHPPVRHGPAPAERGSRLRLL